ncbi:MAG TPA: tryptophan--tRNA ligase [Elusimicrobiota bacterium]|nr:tryptophan--tRNA ligase [Elusimicrobiota bacterium]
MSGARSTVLSGMRPSGKLHLGNYFGALYNWLALQDSYACFYMVADWHALTSEYADPSEIESNVWEMVIDWLACGLDPKRCVIFRQSWVREHAELHLILSMITPIPWLERVPTYKEQIQEVKNRDLSTYGFLGYPVLQSADILLYQAAQVPVGEDQLPHLELTREITRRFNNFYGNVFAEPQALLSRSPRILGTDRRKMSKSYNNAILLSDSPEEIAAQVKTMYTDPQKIRLTDKGHPEGCVVNATHKLYTPEAAEIEERCQAGTIGCVACKNRLAETLNAGLQPIRDSRARWATKLDDVKDIVRGGSLKATETAANTMATVRGALKLSDLPQGVVR